MQAGGAEFALQERVDQRARVLVMDDDDDELQRAPRS